MQYPVFATFCHLTGKKHFLEIHCLQFDLTTLGWLNIVETHGSSNYFNSWRFGDIVDEIFIKTKSQSCKSTVRIDNEILLVSSKS